MPDREYENYIKRLVDSLVMQGENSGQDDYESLRYALMNQANTYDPSGQDPRMFAEEVFGPMFQGMGANRAKSAQEYSDSYFNRDPDSSTYDADAILKMLLKGRR